MGFPNDFARLVLRLMVGGLMLMHGIGKLRHGISGITTMVVAHGLPAWVGYGVLVGEVLAPALLIIGFLGRLAAFALVVNMIFAVWLAHPHDLLKLNDHGTWALELQAFYFFSALAILFLGSGRYAINRGEGRLD